MLSRVAERVYWMARYIERAENTARLVNVYRDLMLDLPDGVGIQWRQLIDISGAENFSPRYRSAGERNVLRIPASDMLRLRWNPFHDELVAHVLEFTALTTR